MSATRFATVAAVLLPLAACQISKIDEGQLGQLEFIPTDCGRLGLCDFAGGIVANGAVTLGVRPTGYVGSLADLAVVTADDTVLIAEAGVVTATESRWNLAAALPGRGDLEVIDLDGQIVDLLPVEVLAPDRLHLVARLGDAVGPSQDRPGYHEAWTVNAGEHVGFDALPEYAGRDLMGRLAFTVEIEQPLFDSLEASAALEEGHLSARPPAGEHPVRFILADGTTLDVLIIAL